MDAAAEGEMEASQTPPEPTLTVSAVARRMGVAPPTLRTWDRRYGLGPSGHTAGAHRRYTSGDVARLLVMRRLTLEGVSPADAAKIAKATPIQGQAPAVTEAASIPIQGGDGFGRGAERPAVAGWPQASPAEWSGSGAAGDEGAHVLHAATDPGLAVYGQDQAGLKADLNADLHDPYSRTDLVDARRALLDDPDDSAGAEAGPSAFDAPWRDEPDAYDGPDSLAVLRDPDAARGSAGGGRVVALPYGTPQSRGLARAAMALDTYETARLLREALRRDGAAATWTSMIMPVLRALGERTQITGDGIDVEHAFSEVVLGSLRTVMMNAPPPGQNAPTVLLACADGDYHSLPLHALGAALAERNVSCRMLGSGLPPHALSASVRRTGPSVVVVFARMPGADASPTQILRRQRPAPTIVLAGPGWQSATIPSFARCAASLDEAIEEVMLGVHR